MNIFSIFKKKAPGKCTECLRPIEGRVWCLDDKKYCRECYNRKMAILQQTGVYHNGGNPVSEKQGGNTPSGRTFVCGICGKELSIKYRHSGNSCAECHASKRTPRSQSTADIPEAVYIDDVTFIRAMKHIPMVPWHQYDVLLAARGYGWDMMKEWADYMADADLEHVSQVTTASLGTRETDVTRSYIDNGGRCTNTPELDRERGGLSVAGISKVLGAPMKIVWYNQTQVLRFFTLVDDELLIKQYAETTIRRTFDTENAMKLGKPIPEGQ